MYATDKSTHMTRDAAPKARVKDLCVPSALEILSAPAYLYNNSPLGKHDSVDGIVQAYYIQQVHKDKDGWGIHCVQDSI